MTGLVSYRGMMRQLYVVSSIPLLLCVGCGLRTQAGSQPAGRPRAEAPAVTSVREESISVAALEQKVETAAALRDASFLDSVWAPTFRFTHADGRAETRAELLSDFRKQRSANDTRALERRVDSLSVELHQHTAVTSGLIHVRRCRGATYREYTVRFIRVYGRRESGPWKLLNHHTVGETESATPSTVGALPPDNRCR